MRRACVLLLFLTMSCADVGALAQAHHSVGPTRHRPTDLNPREARIADLYANSLPTVVVVLTTEGKDSEKRGSIGAGVLISSECHILTASHVVHNADSILVKTLDGKLRPAEVLMSEPSADIALLRLIEPDRTLPHATLGDSDRLSVGQELYAIGAPRGLENSLSVGFISGFRAFDRLYDGTILAEFIQTDAAINMGNSGGPAFDSHGRVIGIASRIISASGGSDGLGFVVAINTAKKLMALEGRAAAGFEAIYLNSEQLGKLFNMEQEGGLLVQKVVKHSPAARAGLRGGVIDVTIGKSTLLLGGDLIVQIGDQAACHGRCLAEAHDRIRLLDKIPVQFFRDGKLHKVTIDVSQSHKSFL